MYKLLISDFEEVVLDNEDAIPLSTMLSLDRMRSKNVVFGIISNKGFKTTLDYNKDFPFVDYIILNNGAYVYSVNKDKAILDNYINVSVVKKIEKLFNKYNLYFYTLNFCNYINEPLNNDNMRRIGDFKVFCNFHKNSIYKIEIYCDNKKEQLSIEEELKKLKLDINCIKGKNDKFFIEITKKGTNRLNAIKCICKDKNIDLDEVAMLSKQDEDADCLKKVGLPAVVEDSSTKLKKLSKEIIPTNEEKGIEYLINKLIK